MWKKINNENSDTGWKKKSDSVFMREEGIFVVNN